MRFELGYYACDPGIHVIAPWREWDLTSRTRLIDYAEKHQIPIPKDKRGEAPYSQDANLLHISSEGKVLEDPWTEADYDLILSRMVTPMAAPDQPTEITIDFEKGDPVAVNGEKMSPATLFAKLNDYGRDNLYLNDGGLFTDIGEQRFLHDNYSGDSGSSSPIGERVSRQVIIERMLAQIHDTITSKTSFVELSSPDRTSGSGLCLLTPKHRRYD